MSSDASETQGSEPLTQARKLLEEGMFEQCMVLLKSYWLENIDDVGATRMFGQLMSETGRTELARQLKELAQLTEALQSPSEVQPGAKTTKSTPESESASAAGSSAAPTEQVTPAEVGEFGDTSQSSYTYALFEAGFGLIDVRQHELALLLLNKCLEQNPDEPTVNYEIAFSLMSLGKFEAAIKHFNKAAQDNEDFDTILNLAVCYTLSRNVSEAKSMLEKLTFLAIAEDEVRELTHRKFVLKRLESLNKKTTLSPRDWLYILYGSVLLQPETSQDQKKDDYRTIAAMLVTLKGFLEGMSLEYEAVEYYNTNARPLARVLGELMELPATSYMGPERPDRALLVMAWAVEIIGPHEAFVEHLESRSIFAYGLTWKEPLPVVAEICGRLTEDSPMPWADIGKIDNEDKIVEQLLQIARTLELDPDILRSSQESTEYYDAKRELIVLNNWEVFPDRPEYTAEVAQPRDGAD